MTRRRIDYNALTELGEDQKKFDLRYVTSKVCYTLTYFLTIIHVRAPQS